MIDRQTFSITNILNRARFLLGYLGKRGMVSEICLYPQPTVLEVAGVLLFDHLTVKKILSRIENLARERLGALYV